MSLQVPSSNIFSVLSSKDTIAERGLFILPDCPGCKVRQELDVWFEELVERLSSKTPYKTIEAVQASKECLVRHIYQELSAKDWCRAAQICFLAKGDGYLEHTKQYIKRGLAEDAENKALQGLQKRVEIYEKQIADSSGIDAQRKKTVVVKKCERKQAFIASQNIELEKLYNNAISEKSAKKRESLIVIALNKILEVNEKNYPLKFLHLSSLCMARKRSKENLDRALNFLLGFFKNADGIYMVQNRDIEEHAYNQKISIFIAFINYYEKINPQKATELFYQLKELIAFLKVEKFSQDTILTISPNLCVYEATILNNKIFGTYGDARKSLIKEFMNVFSNVKMENVRELELLSNAADIYIDEALLEEDLQKIQSYLDKVHECIEFLLIKKPQNLRYCRQQLFYNILFCSISMNSNNLDLFKKNIEPVLKNIKKVLGERRLQEYSINIDRFEKLYEKFKISNSLFIEEGLELSLFIEELMEAGRMDALSRVSENKSTPPDTVQLNINGDKLTFAVFLIKAERLYDKAQKEKGIYRNKLLIKAKDFIEQYPQKNFTKVQELEIVELLVKIYFQLGRMDASTWREPFINYLINILPLDVQCYTMFGLGANLLYDQSQAGPMNKKEKITQAFLMINKAQNIIDRAEVDTETVIKMVKDLRIKILKEHRKLKKK